MNPHPLYEIIGYAASLIILASLVMTNVFWLRLINLIGSVALAVYAWLIGSIPVCAINIIIVAIDAWYILQTLTVSDFFELEPADGIGEAYLKRFFLYRERDLLHYNPALTFEDLQAAQTYLLFRNLLPVGLFAFRQTGSEAEILVDYMIPEYRDFKAGRFLYHTKRIYFKERGIKQFHETTTHAPQIKYLLKSGFTRDPDNPARFTNPL